MESKKKKRLRARIGTEAAEVFQKLAELPPLASGSQAELIVSSLDKINDIVDAELGPRPPMDIAKVEARYKELLTPEHFRLWQSKVKPILLERNLRRGS